MEHSARDQGSQPDIYKVGASGAKHFLEREQERKQEEVSEVWKKHLITMLKGLLFWRILMCCPNSNWCGRNRDIEMNKPSIWKKAWCLLPSARPSAGCQAHSGPGRSKAKVSSWGSWMESTTLWSPKITVGGEEERRFALSSLILVLF